VFANWQNKIEIELGGKYYLTKGKHEFLYTKHSTFKAKHVPNNYPCSVGKWLYNIQTLCCVLLMRLM